MNLNDFIFIEENQTDSFIKIKVSTNANKTQFSKIENGVLKILLNAQPVDGKANSELISFLSKKLKIPKKNLEISSGETSKNKKIKVHNFAKSELAEKFLCYHREIK